MVTQPQAVVLCAGKGERMGTEFRNFQKCALEISGEPLIIQSIRTLILAGIEDIFLLTGHKAEQIEECFIGGPYEKYVKFIFCGDPYRVPLNTLSTIAKAEQYIRRPFLCLHGDILFPSKIITQLLETFKKYYPAMIITVSNRKEIAPTHARVEYDNNLVVKDVKSPENSNANVWVGIDLYQPHIIKECLNPKLISQKDLAKAILAAGEEIRVVEYKEEYIHITTPIDIYLANFTIFCGKEIRRDSSLAGTN